MMRALVLAFALIAFPAAAYFGTPYDYQTPRYNLYETAAKSTVLIQYWQGEQLIGNASGVYLGNGVTVTARHAILDEGGVKMTVNGKPVNHAEKDDKYDLALVYTEELNLPVPTFATHDPVEGDDVMVIGYPMNGDVQAPVVTTGIYGSDREDEYGVMSAPIMSGNSGGGMWVWEDGMWKMSGLAVALANVALPSWIVVPVPHIALIIKPQLLKKFLAKHDVYIIMDYNIDDKA